MIGNRRMMAVVGVLAAAFSLALSAQEDEQAAETSFLDELEVEMHGFYEARAGYRLRNDKYEKDMSIMETRLQLDLSSYPEWGDIKVKGDVFISSLGLWILWT